MPPRFLDLTSRDSSGNSSLMASSCEGVSLLTKMASYAALVAVGGFRCTFRSMPRRFMARTSPRLEAGTLDSSWAAIRRLRSGGLGAGGTTGGVGSRGEAVFLRIFAVKRLSLTELVLLPPAEAGCSELLGGLCPFPRVCWLLATTVGEGAIGPGDVYAGSLGCPLAAAAAAGVVGLGGSSAEGATAPSCACSD